MLIFCIMGDARAFHSKSPLMFSSVLETMGIRGAYVPFNVHAERIGSAVDSLRTLNINGANITAPFKEAVIPHLDQVSEGANIIGAVNTVVRQGDFLKGYNTNAIGFMNAMKDVGVHPDGKTALVFGSGGVARAVVFILNWLRANTIHIAARRADRMQAIAESVGGNPLPLDTLAERPMAVDMVINATSASTPEEAPELAALVERLKLVDCQLVMDLNYGRENNIWQAAAKRRGIAFVDGLPALAHQATRTFALWTGVEVDPATFLQAIETDAPKPGPAPVAYPMGSSTVKTEP